MSRKIGNAQSRATFFRHSAVLSLPAVLLRKLANSELTQQDGWKTQLGRQNDEKMSRKIENAQHFFAILRPESSSRPVA